MPLKHIKTYTSHARWHTSFIWRKKKYTKKERTVNKNSLFWEESLGDLYYTCTHSHSDIDKYIQCIYRFKPEEFVKEFQ